MPSFFSSPPDQLDLQARKWHTIFLAEAGVNGIVLKAIEDEVPRLSHDERRTATRTTRLTLDAYSFRGVPVIASCSAASAREIPGLCREAAEDGADFALVLPPTYFQERCSQAEICGFYAAVADASPIPILVHCHPPPIMGLELDSDTLVQLAWNPKIKGCMFACGNVGKLNRVKSAAPDFFCFGGSADCTAGAYGAGADGAITEVANVAPLTMCRLWTELEVGEGRMSQNVREMHTTVARADWTCFKEGASTRSALLGYGGGHRGPGSAISEARMGALKTELRDLRRIEGLCADGKY